MKKDVYSNMHVLHSLGAVERAAGTVYSTAVNLTTNPMSNFTFVINVGDVGTDASVTVSLQYYDDDTTAWVDYDSDDVDIYIDKASVALDETGTGMISVIQPNKKQVRCKVVTAEAACTAGINCIGWRRDDILGIAG